MVLRTFQDYSLITKIQRATEGFELGKLGAQNYIKFKHEELFKTD